MALFRRIRRYRRGGPKRWKFKTPSGFRENSRRRRGVRYLFCLEMPYLANPGRTRQSLGALKVRNLVARQTLMPTHCRDDLMPYRCVFSPRKNRLPTVLRTFYARSLFQEPDSLSAWWFCRARNVLPPPSFTRPTTIDSSSFVSVSVTNVLQNLSSDSWNFSLSCSPRFRLASSWALRFHRQEFLIIPFC